MRRSTLLLSMAFAASTATSLWLWSELRSERSRIAATDVQPSEPVPPANHPAISSVADSIDVPSPGSPEPGVAEPVVAQTSAGRPQEWMEYQRRLRGHPRYLDERRAQLRLGLATQRDDAVRLFGLTPEQADGVIDLWIERDLRGEFFAIDLSGKINAEQFSELRARNEAQERVDEKALLELLGAQKAEQWKNYVSSQDSRRRVNMLKAQLSGPDMLRDDQVEPLIAVIHEETQQIGRDAAEFRRTLDWKLDQAGSMRQSQEHDVHLLEQANRRIQISAASILSRGQQAMLDVMLERDLEIRRAHLRMQRVYSKIEAHRQSVPSN